MSELGPTPLRWPARVLVAGLCLLGLAALLGSVRAPFHDGAACVVYALLALLASSQRLRMHPNVGTMSLGFLFVFAALFQCGPTAGIAAAVLSALGNLLFAAAHERRQPPLTTLHALGMLSVAAGAAGAMFDGLAPLAPADRHLATLLLPAAAAVGVYYLATIAGVSAMSLLAGYGLPRHWLREAAWMAPVYFAGGAAALAVGLAYRQFGPGVFVLGLPIFYVVQRSYALRADRTAEQLRHLEERTAASEKLAHLYMSVVEALSSAVEAKDQGTRLHVRRVQSLARAVGRRVGLVGEELQAVETAAVLHDIGKLAVPDQILAKPSRLTDSEFELVKAHPEVGEAILRPIDFGVDVGSIVRHHHEKMDGSGYPDGLVGDAIPLAARVLGVIDVYDALVSDRPYRQAWRAERALGYLRTQAGSAFDPAVVEALAQAIGEGEPADEGADDDLRRAVAAAAERAALPAEASPQPWQPLVEEWSRRAPVHTCVAYELDPRHAEVAVVAAAGEYAETFARLRTPLGLGPSAAAARAGRVVLGAGAVADVAGAPGAPPEGLAASMVAAVPVVESSGTVRVVISLYTYLDAEAPDNLLAEVAVRAAQAAQPLAAPEREQGELLEYAAFLAALERSVTRARQHGERLVVMAVGLPEPDPERLLALGQELRLAGRGQARVAERESAGEIILALPPVVEAAARECLQAFDASEAGGFPVGSAVFPADADSAHGLICVAQMRRARDHRAAAPEGSACLSVPA